MAAFKWRFFIKNCALVALTLIGFVWCGWYFGDRAFIEHVRKLRVMHQSNFFADAKAGYHHSDPIDVECERLLVEREQGLGFTTAKAFSIAYAYSGFWYAVALTGTISAARLLWAIRSNKQAGSIGVDASEENEPAQGDTAGPEST